jgi:hypothetical protein
MVANLGNVREQFGNPEREIRGKRKNGSWKGKLELKER